MKQFATFILLCLYIGYLSIPVISAFCPDEFYKDAKYCVTVNHFLDAKSCDDSEQCPNEFSGMPLLSNQHHLVSAAIRTQYNSSIAILPFIPAWRSVRTPNHNIFLLTEQKVLFDTPLFLQNRVLRL